MSQYTTEQFRASCGAIAPLQLIISGPGWDGSEPHVFEHPFVLVGRHELSGLRLDDEAISRKHAYLQQLGGRLFCVDLGSRTGIRWGQESRPAGWLRPGEGIQMGPFTLDLPAPDPAAIDSGEQIKESWDPLQDRVSDSRLLPCLAVEVGNEQMSQMRLNRSLLLVGSSPGCRIRLRHDTVSKYHCSLVRTSEGVWIVDLLSGSGIRVNGQPVPWALLNDGDWVRVGPYVLRFWYEDVGEESPTAGLEEDRARTSAQAQSYAMPSAEQTAIADSSRVSALQAELDETRARLQDAEALIPQLADSRAECDQLRERFAESEIKLAELAALQARLEAAETGARELETVRAERDRWQTEAQNLQSRISSESEERNGLQQRLDEAQRQLAEEREAVRALDARIEQESASLQEVRADLAARNAEFAESLQRLQETQEELTRARDEARDLQAELDQAREGQRHTEELGQQLSDARGASDQLGVRIRELEDKASEVEPLRVRLHDSDTEREQLRAQLRDAEARIADSENLRSENLQLSEQIRVLNIEVEKIPALQTRLEAAETTAQELEIVRAERERLQSEAQDLQTRIASDSAEREELRHRLDEAQEQSDRLGTRLRELEDQAGSAELLRSQLQDAEAEMERLRAQLQAAQSHAAEMEGVREESVQLREQVRALEIQAAEIAPLQARLQAAEEKAHELELVCAERDRWQTEAQDLQTRIASNSSEREQFDRLTADLQGAQAERERLLAEHQSSLQVVDQATARMSDLERELTDAKAAHEKAIAEARALWESERQTLEARLVQAHQPDDKAVQAAIRDAQIRAEAAIRDIQSGAAAEREQWRQRLEGAEAQIVWERGLSQEQSGQLRQQIAMLQAERDRLAARLGQSDSPRAASVERRQEPAVNIAQPAPLQQLSVRDQIFAEIRSIQVGHPIDQAARPQGQDKPTEMGRGRGSPEVPWNQGGEQQHRIAIEQGIEAAWAQAAARERQATTRPPANRVEQKNADLAPESGAGSTVEHQSPAGTLSSDPPGADTAATASSNQPETPANLEGEQPGEEVHRWRSEGEDEENQGLLRKFFNFVRGK